MKRNLTLIELAEYFSIHPVTVAEWVEQGMPTTSGRPIHAFENDDGKRPWQSTRRELAVQWDVHPDTVSRWLPDGLGAAIVERRGRNEPVFDMRLATRWNLARDAMLSKLVLEDFVACAKAGIAAVHILSPTYSFMREREDEDAARRK